jgi:acetyl esterase/lipase
MAALEAEPIAGTLERALAAVDRRRALMTDPRLAMVAAGSAGALFATVMVARALRQRRRTPERGPIPGLAGIAAPVLVRAK